MKISNKTNQSRENIERINPVTHVTLTVGGCVLPRDWTETQEEIADFRGKLRRKKVKKNKTLLHPETCFKSREEIQRALFVQISNNQVSGSCRFSDWLGGGDVETLNC